MSTSDHDWCTDLARGNQVVEGQACLVSLPIAEPADARRQALEADLVASATQPLLQPRIVMEQIHHSAVGDLDVVWVARQGHPAERAFALTEQGPDVGRHESGKLEGAFAATPPGLVAN